MNAAQLPSDDEKAAIELVCRWCMDYGIATGHANRLSDVLDQIRLHGCQKALDAELLVCADMVDSWATEETRATCTNIYKLIIARIGMRAK